MLEVFSLVIFIDYYPNIIIKMIGDHLIESKNESWNWEIFFTPKVISFKR